MIAAAMIALLACGVFFQLVAAVGLVRFPDLYCRLHVTCLNDTLGSPLILAAAAVHSGASLVTAKLVVLIGLLYLTSPLVGHLLSRAALEAGIRPAGLDDGGGSVDAARD